MSKCRPCQAWTGEGWCKVAMDNGDFKNIALTKVNGATPEVVAIRLAAWVGTCLKQWWQLPKTEGEAKLLHPVHPFHFSFALTKEDKYDEQKTR